MHTCGHMPAGEEAGGAGRIQRTWEQLHKGSPRPHTAPSDTKTFWAKPNYFVSETRKLILSSPGNWLALQQCPSTEFQLQSELPVLLRVNASPKNSDGQFSTICKGSAYLTPSPSERIRCPPPPQFSARTQPLGRTYKASALWWKVCPWYIKILEKDRLYKRKRSRYSASGVAPHLVYPRSGQTQQLLRSRAIKMLFSFLDPCRVINPWPLQMQGQPPGRSAAGHRTAGLLRAIHPQIIV